MSVGLPLQSHLKRRATISPQKTSGKNVVNQYAVRQFIKCALIGGIGATLLSVAAHAEQCDERSAKMVSIAPPQPALHLPETPAGMDVDATGVVVNGAVAIGTFAAAAAAVWAALSERRKRKREDLVVGRLTAAGIASRLDIAADVMSSISAAFNDAMEIGVLTLENANNMRAGVESIPRCTFDEIKSMVPLRGDCAALIAAAQDRLHVAAGTLHVLSDPGISPGQKVICQGRCRDALRQSSLLFTRAKSICDTETSAVHAALNSADSTRV
ncbi:hypothetical protein [Paraburkholderia sp. J94]|uniref:hypothetical protein n=1 Tax=Paraburkholderia sp. J94 TaxID=2805441 RepID=UPI002AAF19DB|nr:hypothetical protein [Paraburkholderia sp. J94]